MTLFDTMDVKALKDASADRVRFYFEEKEPKVIKQNTVEKLLILAREKWPHLPFYEISIQKNIPIGAGLGGGSSNAGTLLKHLAEGPLKSASTDQLIHVASRIGADVPFFLDPKPTWVTGIGEELAPAVLPFPLYLVIVKPPFPVSTKEAYGWYDAMQHPQMRESPSRPQLKMSNLQTFLDNDLEAPVLKFRPQIDDIKKQLLEVGAKGSLMTGSGSAVFGIFESPEKSHKAYLALNEKLKSCKIYDVKSIH